MSLVRERRRGFRTRRTRARQGQRHQGRALGDHHFEASPLTSVTGTFEAARRVRYLPRPKRRCGLAAPGRGEKGMPPKQLNRTVFEL